MTHEFSRRLLAWQRRHGRHDLPWQADRDPYRVWLSEIMLQQTQVATVMPYYARFLERFPNLAALAAAPRAEVMTLWSGLGYYARARNLHACAQVVMSAHGGAFPRTPEALAALPGIGRSTANAIATVCFGARAAILDGNVKRVLCRVFGVDGIPASAPVEKRLWALAAELMPAREAARYNQGLMDLGATCCTARAPACAACPLAALCVARAENRQAELPTPRLRRTLPEREMRLLIVLAPDGRVLLERRPGAGLWGGLEAPPELAPDEDVADWCRRHLACAPRAVSPAPSFWHVFTHFRCRIAPLLCHLNALPTVAGEDRWRWLDPAQADAAALPTPVRRIVVELG